MFNFNEENVTAFWNYQYCQFPIYNKKPIKHISIEQFKNIICAYFIILSIIIFSYLDMSDVHLI